MVYILSWNVSGWSATVGHILKRHNTVDAFFEKHGSPEIICLQEVKIDKDKLRTLETSRIGPSSCADGSTCTNPRCSTQWTSFWSFSLTKKGYSGVTTFARKESLVRATSKVFRDRFDDEGRCVATLHDFSQSSSCINNSNQNLRFLLINVYVPYGGSSEVRLQYKHEFLHKLAGSIKRLKKEWGVEDFVLTGDLNVSLRDVDVHWLYRTFPGDFDIDRHEDIRSYRKDHIKSLREVFKKEKGFIDFEGAVSAARKKRIPGEIFRQFAEEHGVLPLWKALCSQIFHSLFCDENALRLTDTFAHCHRDARNRFTCWDQSRNRRFKNIGTRIDYILVSTNLKDCLVSVKKENENPSDLIDVTTGDSALISTLYLNEHSTCNPLSDATANGEWKATTDPMFEYRAKDKAYDHQFLRTKVQHTGMVYTPPLYSDHIAVSLKLQWSATENPVSTCREEPSKQEPFVSYWDLETTGCNISSYTRTLKQRDITSFFRQVES